LLNTSHEEGRGKALFFLHVGFSVEQPNALAQALIRHANEHDVVKDEITRFGTRYVVEGDFHTPVGRIVQLRSVWFIAKDDLNPRLVTAYPMEAEND
jgi:hypothetical protein